MSKQLFSQRTFQHPVVRQRRGLYSTQYTMIADFKNISQTFVMSIGKIAEIKSKA